MRIFVATSPDDFASEFDDIELMFSLGLDGLILKKRLFDTVAEERFYERWLMALPFKLREKIWVQCAPDIAENLSVCGCVASVSAISLFNGNINCIAYTTCSELLSLNSISAIKNKLNAIMIGPVFQPLSAIAPVKILGVDFIKKILVKCDVPVIAFGGVDFESAQEFCNLPINGVVSLGGVWNYANPVEAFVKLKSAFK